MPTTSAINLFAVRLARVGRYYVPFCASERKFPLQISFAKNITKKLKVCHCLHFALSTQPFPTTTSCVPSQEKVAKVTPRLYGVMFSCALYLPRCQRKSCLLRVAAAVRRKFVISLKLSLPFLNSFPVLGESSCVAVIGLGINLLSNMYDLR